MTNGLTDLIAQYLRNEFGRVPASDEPLLGTGLLDSLRFVLFITHIEQELGTRIPEEDLNEENFRDIRSTIAYLSTLGSPRFSAAVDERIRVER